MWYVNCFSPTSNNYILYGFILTMWYVNKKVVRYQYEQALGFILTMWYVNNQHFSFPPFSLYLFYINYVVCKLINSLKQIKNKIIVLY